MRQHPKGGETIDFADPEGVKTLNRALLVAFYGLEYWDIPAGYLCPPVPSRADYLHHVAELLEKDVGSIPTGPEFCALDLGTGANCIYPILGTKLFGWRFIGTDVDAAAIKWGKQLISANAALSGNIDLRRQAEKQFLFRNVIRENEQFVISLCNPPFHGSPEEAASGTLRKLRNLGGGVKPEHPVLNFGGRANELWCEGGEAGFIRRMIRESAERSALCVWFTTLVSKKGTLPLIERELHRAKAADVRVLSMFAGQKQTRVLAWSFLSRDDRMKRLIKKKVDR